ncbi:unnamed protein product, partial [Mesorhabditis spiculigera]
MWFSVLALFYVSGAIDAHVDLRYYTQCFKRELRVGDQITAKGYIIPGAMRWTCAVQMSDGKNLQLHLDHRIKPQKGEGSRGTHINSRPGTSGWNKELYHAQMPYSEGEKFEIQLRFTGERAININFINGAWSGTTFSRPNVPLSVARQITCYGDVKDVTFQADVMRDKVSEEKTRDCLTLPDSSQPLPPPPPEKPHHHHHHPHPPKGKGPHRHHHKNNGKGGSSSSGTGSDSHQQGGSDEDGFDGFNVVVESSEGDWPS